MSFFLNLIYSYYQTYKYIITIIIITIILSIVYYIYLIYYISSMFHFYQNDISIISYYSDINIHNIYNNNPSIEINLSLFELQNTILIIIIWASIILAPWYSIIAIFFSKNFYHIKLYQIIIIVVLLIVITLIHTVYIPSLLKYTYEYYKIYQIQHESLHFNIEYNILEIIKYVITTIGGIGIVLIIRNYINSRLLVICLYAITIPWNQPVLILISTIFLYTLIQEIITIVRIVQINYLKEIALHCK